MKTADWLEFIHLLRTQFLLTLGDGTIARLEDVCVSAAAQASKEPEANLGREDACIRAALHAVDSLGEHITRQDAERRRAEAAKEFVGIGLELSRPSGPSGPVRIVRSIENSPAERAGLLPGDDIVEIDGIDISSMSLTEVVRDVFRGPSGSTVKVRVKRGSDGSDLTVAAVREQIRVFTAKARLFRDERVLYVRLSQFRKETPGQLAMAVTRARGASPLQLRKLILDLRGNPGGSLDEVVTVGYLFLPPGATFASSRDRFGRTDYRVPDQEPNGSDALVHDQIRSELRELPVTVLVNGTTAAGAELLAQSLRELRGARVVGSSTAMYADIQTWQTLPSGARIRFTTAKLTSAKDKSWEREGVQIDDVRSDLRVEFGDVRTDRVLVDQLRP